MIEVSITQNMISNAKAKAIEMGTLRNSITDGEGNLAGFIGEEIALSVIGGKITNTYDYDLVSKTGFKVDVKTKRTTVAPLPHYECSVAELNTKQDCDYYAFVRVNVDRNVGWFLGVYKKDNYYRDATYLIKGQIDPSNNFKVKSNCYNLPISKLK